MIEDNQLYNRLKNITPPEASNPEFQERLFKRLEKLAQKPDLKQKVLVFKKPVFWAVAGAAAAACFAIAIMLFQFTPAEEKFQNCVARYINSPNIQKHILPTAMSGTITVTQNSIKSNASLDSQITFPASLTLEKDSFLLLQYTDSALIQFEEQTEAYLTSSISSQKQEVLTVRLISGKMHVKTTSYEKSNIIIETEFGSFSHTGTIYSVESIPDKGAKVTVFEGTVTAYNSAETDQIHISQGREMLFYKNKAPIDQPVSPETALKIQEFRLRTPHTGADSEILYKIEINCVPKEADIITSRGFSGKGNISFFLTEKESITITAVYEGCTSASAEIIASKNQAITLSLMPREKDTVEESSKEEIPDEIPPKEDILGEEIPVEETPIKPLKNTPRGSLFSWEESMLIAADSFGMIDSKNTGADIADVYYTAAQDTYFFCIGFNKITGAIMAHLEYRITVDLQNNKVLVLSTVKKNNNWSTDLKIIENNAIIYSAIDISTCVEGPDFVEIAFPQSAIKDWVTPGKPYPADIETRTLISQKNEVLIDETENTKIKF